MNTILATSKNITQSHAYLIVLYYLPIAECTMKSVYIIA